MFEPSTTVREIVVSTPEATAVFERFRVDYSCRASRSLRDACMEDGADLAALAKELSRLARDRSAPRWIDRPLAELTRHIVARHHRFTRAALERIEALSESARDTAEVAPLLPLLEQLDEDLRPHLAREERVLFPYIEELETAVKVGRRRPIPAFGAVANPLRAMMREHDEGGQLLRAIRRAAHDYAPPANAPPAVAELYRELAALEHDLFEHVHLEANILFPRAIELESRQR